MEAQDVAAHDRRMAALGQLAAGIAHEINNPLGFIRANVETLSDYMRVLTGLLLRYREASRATDQERVAAVAEIERTWEQEDVPFILDDVESMLGETLNGADRASGIVSSLKTFARADAGAIVDVDLNGCIQSALLMVKNELKYHCTIVEDLNAIPTIRGNLVGLHEVFVNLLLNAGKAVVDTGTITLSSNAQDGWVTVSVSDTGVGMDEETKARMFDPFFTTREVGSGPGLGLSYCMEVISAHNGRIDVTTRPNAGTTVAVSLPLAA